MGEVTDRLIRYWRRQEVACAILYGTLSPATTRARRFKEALMRLKELEESR